MFENYRMIMESTRVSYLFSQGKYKKVCRMTKKTDNRMATSFYFRSLFMLNKKELTEKALIDYLNHTSVPLISLRNILGEVIADERMKAVLITERSQDEFNEMINCLEKERMSKENYRTFAERMMEYYQEKEKIKQ